MSPVTKTWHKYFKERKTLDMWLLKLNLRTSDPVTHKTMQAIWGPTCKIDSLNSSSSVFSQNRINIGITCKYCWFTAESLHINGKLKLKTKKERSCVTQTSRTNKGDNHIINWYEDIPQEGFPKTGSHLPSWHKWQQWQECGGTDRP